MADAILRGSCLTAPGESGLAVFRVTGEGVVDLLGQIFRGTGQLREEDLHVGRLVDGQEVLDEVVVHLETGGRAAEISTHGGSGTRAAVGHLLASLGVQEVPAEDLLLDQEQACDMLARETLHGLQEAWSLHAMLFFLDAARGRLGRFARDCKSVLEADPAPAPEALRALRQELACVRSRAAFGRAFCEPPSIVLAGPPNAGKSSLANALLGAERLIVTPEKGTTRDLVRLQIPLRGLPFQLADCAGLREGPGQVEALGMERTLEAVQRADLNILVLDGSQPPPVDALQPVLQASAPCIVALNKRDLGLSAPAEEVARLVERVCVPISATEGEGLDDLVDLVVFRSPFRGPALRSSVVPFTARQETCLQAALDAVMLDPGLAAVCIEALLEGDPRAPRERPAAPEPWRPE